MRDTLSARETDWHILTAPSTEELVSFVRDIKLEPIDADFIARAGGRPEVALRDNYLLLLIHVPVFHRKLRVTSGVPLYFVVTEHALYSISYDPIVSLQKLIKDFEDHPERLKEHFTGDSLHLLLNIVSALNESSFRKLGRLSKHIEIAEDAVFHGNERKMVEEVAVLTRDVLDFRKIIRPHRNLFATVPERTFTHETRAQWARLHGHFHQLWEILESLLDSSKELRDTNDSLLQYKENELLRMLSYYSIVAIPVWIFVTPFDPFSGDSTLVDTLVFFGILGGLALILLYIFIRGKRRRVL